MKTSVIQKVVTFFEKVWVWIIGFPFFRVHYVTQRIPLRFKVQHGPWRISPSLRNPFQKEVDCDRDHTWWNCQKDVLDLIQMGLSISVLYAILATPFFLKWTVLPMWHLLNVFIVIHIIGLLATFDRHTSKWELRILIFADVLALVLWRSNLLLQDPGGDYVGTTVSGVLPKFLHGLELGIFPVAVLFYELLLEPRYRSPYASETGEYRNTQEVNKAVGRLTLNPDSDESDIPSEEDTDRYEESDE